MTFKNRTINLILNSVSDTKQRLRQLEDECRRFSVDPGANGVYVGLVGYQEALQDLLSDIRSMNENDGSNRDI